jgi:hypothetical protein
MNAEKELKNDLISLITKMDDLQFLQQLKKLLVGKAIETDYDWADELSEEQLIQIKLGQEQVANGQFVSSEELHLGVAELLKRKRAEKKWK